MSDFGPRDESEKLVFTVEALRVDFQQALYTAMRSAGVTESQLAIRAHLPQHQIHALFEPDSNPSLVMIGRVMNALGARLVFRLEPTK